MDDEYKAIECYVAHMMPWTVLATINPIRNPADGTEVSTVESSIPELYAVLQLYTELTYIPDDVKRYMTPAKAEITLAIMRKIRENGYKLLRVSLFVGDGMHISMLCQPQEIAEPGDCVAIFIEKTQQQARAVANAFNKLQLQLRGETLFIRSFHCF